MLTRHGEVRGNSTVAGSTTDGKISTCKAPTQTLPLTLFAPLVESAVQVVVHRRVVCAHVTDRSILLHSDERAILCQMTKDLSICGLHSHPRRNEWKCNTDTTSVYERQYERRTVCVRTIAMGSGRATEIVVAPIETRTQSVLEL